MRPYLAFLFLPFVQIDTAAAHHAFAADYEPGNEGEVEGVITEVIYKNPHARYYLEVTNDDGSKELWDLQTMNLMMLGRVGWTKDTLQVGDHIKVEGILGRHDTKRMSISVVTADDGRVISPQRGIRESSAELSARGSADVAASGKFDSIASNITPGRYELDDTHAYLSFSYSHLGLSNPQIHFADFEASLELNGNDMSLSHVSIIIDAASVDSAVPALDDDLKGADFFDVENYPKITFKSTAYEETSESSGRLTGDLSVRGVTKPITLEVTINSASMNPLNRREMIGFSATGSFNRSDYGLTGYAPLIGDELSLAVQIEFEKVP
ncbi:MAG: YceI family protein [Proteobacteria bacterium]|nr:YceI family protein [Pseudomonadota bacterium]